MRFECSEGVYFVVNRLWYFRSENCGWCLIGHNAHANDDGDSDANDNRSVDDFVDVMKGMVRRPPHWQKLRARASPIRDRRRLQPARVQGRASTWGQGVRDHPGPGAR